jgi:hypothetical protein
MGHPGLAGNQYTLAQINFSLILGIRTESRSISSTGSRVTGGAGSPCMRAKSA